MVNSKIYLLAGVLTVIIVLATVGISMLIDSLRRDYIKSEMENFKRDMDILGTETIIVESIGQTIPCGEFKNTALLSDLFKKLGEIENKIKYYENSNIIFKTTEANAIKEEYILMSLKSWIILQNMQKKCENNDFMNILYIYDASNCEYCDKQGMVLDYYKQMLNEKFLVFSVDGSFSNPALEIIKDVYNYKKAPMLIINGVAYDGFVGKEDMKSIICSSGIPAEDLCSDKK